MITFKEYFELFVEMARPAKSFDDPVMNKAYADSLKKFKQLGIHNANTYTIWDFIFRLLPENIRTPEIEMKKKKAHGTFLRGFVTDFLLKNQEIINMNKLADDMNNINFIKSYIYRPIRQGDSRRIGKDNTRKELFNRKKLLEH